MKNNSNEGLNTSIIERDLLAIARGSKRIPIAVKSAKGAIIKDYEGNKFIDLTSGWNVTNVGWNNSRIIKKS